MESTFIQKGCNMRPTPMEKVVKRFRKHVKNINDSEKTVQNTEYPPLGQLKKKRTLNGILITPPLGMEGGMDRLRQNGSRDGWRF